MTDVVLRPARDEDVPALARLRAATWGEADDWQERISGYRDGRRSPEAALDDRCVIVAEIAGEVVGMVAGHRTRRHGCDGELQWIDVHASRRGTGVADRLLSALAGWFGTCGVQRVCVDVAPENTRARAFYARHGAHDLRPHWMVWEDIAASTPHR